MTDEEDRRRDRPAGSADPEPEEGHKPRGNSLQDASEEMVGFMEKGDEPGHAGHGDGG